MLKSGLKQVVIAGITPFHCIVIVSPNHSMNISVIVSLARFRCPRETRQSNRKHRRANRLKTPPEEEFNRGPANTALAGSHSAACVQLCRPPARLLTQPLKAHVFASTYESAGLRQVSQF